MTRDVADLSVERHRRPLSWSRPSNPVQLDEVDPDLSIDWDWKHMTWRLQRAVQKVNSNNIFLLKLNKSWLTIFYMKFTFDVASANTFAAAINFRCKSESGVFSASPLMALMS